MRPFWIGAGITMVFMAVLRLCLRHPVAIFVVCCVLSALQWAIAHGTVVLIGTGVTAVILAALFVAISESSKVRTIGGLILAVIAVVAGVSVLAVYDSFASIAAGAAGFWTFDTDTLVLVGMVTFFVVAGVAGTLHTVTENRRAVPQPVAGPPPVVKRSGDIF